VPQAPPAPATIASASPQVAPVSNAAVATAVRTSANTAFLWPLIVGGGLLIAAAAAFATWLVMRPRQHQGSLITSSMQVEQSSPPPK
jgi:hypothetical protein